MFCSCARRSLYSGGFHSCTTQKPTKGAHGSRHMTNDSSPRRVSRPGDVTALLQLARSGDRQAWDDVFDRVYGELRRRAQWVRRGRAGDTMSATALVHEAYLKLIPSADLEFRDRAHFFAVAARAMR